MTEEKDLTIIYYTSNYLDTANPYFLENTRKQLLKAAGNLPIISVSQKPCPIGENICLGDIGRSHLNIYRQILVGCKAAKTKYVAMAEDDILYSYEHFHFARPKYDDIFLYDMNKLSLFTWGPPLFSFRHNRMVVNQLIAPTQYLAEALQERFDKYKDKKPDLRIWGDPGRYERQLGVTERRSYTLMCNCPSIVFSHEYAYGYMTNQGQRKRLGDLRIIEVPFWGRAEDVLKLYKK